MLIEINLIGKDLEDNLYHTENTICINIFNILLCELYTEGVIPEGVIPEAQGCLQRCRTYLNGKEYIYD